jgi:hypothetical protein
MANPFVIHARADAVPAVAALPHTLRAIFLHMPPPVQRKMAKVAADAPAADDEVKTAFIMHRVAQWIQTNKAALADYPDFLDGFSD